MKLYLPDANILINAFRQDAPHHEACARWLEDTGLADVRIGLCELVEAAFLRIVTLPKIGAGPMDLALGFWEEDLWSHPRLRRLHPGASHNAILASFIMDLALLGNDVNDAWLAALAVGHQATLVSLDRGFARFPGLDWLDPSST